MLSLDTPQSVLQLFFSGKELFKKDIELLCNEFRTNEQLDGADEHYGFASFHFGCVGTEFIQKFRTMYNCKNDIDYLITEDMLSLFIRYNDNIIEIGA